MQQADGAVCQSGGAFPVGLSGRGGECLAEGDRAGGGTETGRKSSGDHPAGYRLAGMRYDSLQTGRYAKGICAERTVATGALSDDTK